MDTTSKSVICKAVTTTITTLAASALLLLATGMLSAPIFAQEHSDQVVAHEMRLPQTPEEHRARAERYRNKAAEYRQEAMAHRNMLFKYSQGVATSPKAVLENPYIKRMRLHCEKYIAAADSLAREADEMMKFHLMRAKEMEGQ